MILKTLREKNIVICEKTVAIKIIGKKIVDSLRELRKNSSENHFPFGRRDGGKKNDRTPLFVFC